MKISCSRTIASEITLFLLLTTVMAAQTKPRARDLGIPFDGTPGALNAITDVRGVEVGHATLISGSGKLVVGKGPVRTGVTAILPRGKKSDDQVFAGWFSLNGNGEMTGTTWVEESGFLEGPIKITNTHSVGVVRDSVIAWRVEHGQPAGTEYWWSLPVVAETYDGFLNDVNGFHVKREDVFEAPGKASLRQVVEGNGGGDIFTAFSTANPDAARPAGLRQLQMVPNDQMGPLFEATVEAVEEAIVNALVAAETMTGIDDHQVLAIPHDRLKQVLKSYNRLTEPK